MSALYGPDYDKITGVEDAKRNLSEWEWGDAIVVDDVTIQDLLKKLSMSAAGVVIDEIERSFEVLFRVGNPPELIIWPIGLDHPEVTVSLARLVDEFIDILIEDHDEEEVVAFSAWLRTTADKLDANINRCFRTTSLGEIKNDG